QCDQLLPHALACAGLVRRYHIAIPESAHLLNHAGYYLFQQADYKEAEQLLQQALRIQTKLEQDHPGEKEILNGKVQILNDLGLLYCRKHKYKQAEPLLQQALRIQEQLNDPNPGQSLWILG